MGDDDQTKLCTNCQRDIPAANYTIHSVHCTRNIRICQKCKEPVPVADMQKHTARVSCKQCGEWMQACDVAAHLSDACAQTPVQCPYCELLLGRVLMADHELYCGTRTERCPECHELVMHKYQRLHDDSNHGFIKLDDEPGPQPSWESPPARPVASPGYDIFQNWRAADPFPSFASQIQSAQSSARFNPAPQPYRPNGGSSSSSKSANLDPISAVKVTEGHISAPKNFVKPVNNGELPKDDRITNERASSNHLPAKRTNDMPQVNSTAAAAGSSAVDKDPVKQPINRPSQVSRGAIKKYMAPQPPSGARRHREIAVPISPPNSPDFSDVFKHTRDVPLYSALKREQDQTRRREELNAYNLANDLPLLTTPLQKLEKLRKMSGHAGNESENIKPKNKKNQPQKQNDFTPYTPMSPEELEKRMKRHEGGPGHADALQSRPLNEQFARENDSANFRHPLEGNDEDLYNLHQYESVNYSTWNNPAEPTLPADIPTNRVQPYDRFMEIKNDLRVLRKELKECSSPLQAKKSPTKNQASADQQPRMGNAVRGNNLHLNLQNPNSAKLQNRPKQNGSSRDHHSPWGPEVMLPCEFCKRMIPAALLVEHEENCGSDLAQNTTYVNELNSPEPSGSPDYSPRPPERRSHKHKNTKKEIKSKVVRVDNISNLDANNELNVLLPCEFCQKMVPAHFLVMHETGCNPLVTSVQMSSEAGAIQTVPTVASNANAAPPNTPDGYPLVKSTNIGRAKDTSRNHRHRNLDIAQDERPINSIPNPSSLGHTDEAVGSCDLEEVRLPCEFCMTLIPAHQLMYHQEECYVE